MGIPVAIKRERMVSECQSCGESLMCRYRVVIYDRRLDSTYEYEMCNDCAEDLYLRHNMDVHPYAFID